MKAKHYVNISKSRKKICLSLHYNAANTLFYANSVKIHQLKAKVFEIQPYSLSFGNISKHFTVKKMKKNGLNGLVYNFSISYDTIDVSDIENIYKYLMKKTHYCKNDWFH